MSPGLSASRGVAHGRGNSEKVRLTVPLDGCRSTGLKGQAPDSRGVLIKRKILLLACLIAAAGAGYYFRVYVPAHRLPAEVAYVLPISAVVVDTPAEVRMDVAQLRGGDMVYVINRTTNWAHIRLADGKSG